MRLFPPEIEVGPNEGFTSENDIFGRKHFGDQLTRIVRELDGPAVVLLDAPWGMGKTTFIKMWRGELSKQQVPSIYFDAFANDYHEDAFLALAGEIVDYANGAKGSAKRTATAFRIKAINVGKVLGRAALGTAVQIATAGIVGSAAVEAGLDAATEVGKKMGESTAEKIDKLIEQRIDNHRKDREAFEGFKTALEEVAVALSARDETQNTVKVPLIFIIDELDRCRPTFSLELLEKIKHFFSVERVVFVLVASLDQLEKSVRYAYGSDIDAKTYLEKFYHLRLLFPVARALEGRQPSAKTYLQYLSGRILSKGTAGVLDQQLVETIAAFDRFRPLSFRTLERILTYAALLNVSLGENRFAPRYLVASLSMLRVLAPSLYDKARVGTLSFPEVSDFFQFPSWRHEQYPEQRAEISQRVEVYWRYMLGAELPEREKTQMDQGLAPYNFYDTRQALSFLCNTLDGFAFQAK
jgi:hypothetical protein